MGIKINPSVWNSIFAVPTALIDEHIKLAGGQQLKVFLYILRHNNENVDIDEIAAGCGMTKPDVKDAMQYWVSTGFLGLDESELKPIEIHSDKPVRVPAAPLTELPDVVPTYQQVAQRMLESPEIRELFNEAQMRLGRTVGYSEQATLLMLHDHYGLPIEVLLTIIQYCVSIGKNSMRYIEKVGKDWAENDINTLEAADEHIKKLQATEKMWKKFENMFSVDPPKYTDKRCTFLKKWHLEYKQSFELIYYAYEETINRINKPQFSYMDSMLAAWHDKGYKSPVDVIQAAKEYTENKKTITANGKSTTTAATGATRKPSYDSDRAKKRAQAPIEYKRRNTNG